MNQDLFRAFENVLADPAAGWPTAREFERHEVYIEEALVQRAEGLLNHHHFCLIRGPEGRGKTVLARTLAFRWPQRDEVFVLDLAYVQSDQAQQILLLLDRLAQRKHALLVIENAHRLSDDLVQKIIARCAQEGNRAYFLFTARKVFTAQSGSWFLDPFKSFITRGWNIDLTPDLSMACHIIRAFIEARPQLDYSLDDEDKVWLEQEVGPSKVNLRRLRWYLEVWIDKGGRLCTVSRQEVLTKVLTELIHPLDISSQHLLIRAAAVFQFDVPFCDATDDDQPALAALTQRSLLSSRSGNLYRMEHATDANYLLEAYAFFENEDASTVTFRLLTQYLGQQPANAFQLLITLLQRHDPIAGALLRQVKDFANILPQGRSANLSGAATFLNGLMDADQPRAALDFWKVYKGAGAGAPFLASGPEESLEDRVNRASCKLLGSLLGVLHRLDPEECERFAEQNCSAELLSQKVKSASALAVHFLFRRLPPSLVGDLADGIFLTAVAQRFNQKPTASAVSGIVSVARLLPSDKRELFFDALDGSRLGAEAARQHFHRTVELLHCCTRHPQKLGKQPRSGFASDFMKALHGSAEFLPRLRQTSISTVFAYFGTASVVNLALVQDLQDRLTADDWCDMLVASSLTHIAHALYWLPPVIPRSRSFKMIPASVDRRAVALAVMRRLTGRLFQQKVDHIYAAKETRPVKSFGLLVAALDRAVVPAARGDLKRMAGEIAVHIRFEDPRWTAAEWSMLLANVKAIDDEVWASIAHKVARKYDFTNCISTNLGADIGFLLYHFARVVPREARKLADRIWLMQVRDVFATSECDALSIGLQSLSVIDIDRTRKWIEPLSDAEWLSKASTAPECFHLIWTLLWIDQLKAAGLIASAVNKLVGNGGHVTAEQLPLVGVARYYCGLSGVDVAAYPTTKEIANWIVTSAGLADLAFCIYGEFRVYSGSAAAFDGGVRQFRGCKTMNCIGAFSESRLPGTWTRWN